MGKQTKKDNVKKVDVSEVEFFLRAIIMGFFLNREPEEVLKITNKTIKNFHKFINKEL